MPVDVLSVTLRALSFVALFQAAGMVIFDAAFGHRTPATTPQIRRCALLSTWFGLLLVAGHYSLEPARMAGDYSGVTDLDLHGLVLHSSTATAFFCRIAGLLFIAIGLHKTFPRSRHAHARAPSREHLQDDTLTVHSSVSHPPAHSCPLPSHAHVPVSRIALVGVVLVIVSFALMGHTTGHSARWLLTALLVVHLFIAAFWFGALLPLFLTTQREKAPEAGALVERFSASGLWLVPALFAAGLGLAALLLGSVAALASAYGQLVLLKVGGFALLMLLASVNKWRLGPAITRGHAQTIALFRYSLMAEYVLIAAVLTATAILTTFYSP